jgi:transcriptional regulator with XRE-family HTH domain
MMIGVRIREIREHKKLSQTDIEARSGMVRSYISRVENGHTLPSIETLEKFARALEIELYQLVYDSLKPPTVPELGPESGTEWGGSGKSARFMKNLRYFLGRMEGHQRELLFAVAKRMASSRNCPDHPDSL